MNNPFSTGTENENEFTGGCFYSDHIEKEIDGVEVGESKSIDRAGADIPTSRSRIQYVSGKLNVKFRTKVLDDVLWVKRVK